MFVPLLHKLRRAMVPGARAIVRGGRRRIRPKSLSGGEKAWVYVRRSITKALIVVAAEAYGQGTVASGCGNNPSNPAARGYRQPMAYKLTANWKVICMTAKSRSVDRPTPSICCHKCIGLFRCSSRALMGTHQRGVGQKHLKTTQRVHVPFRIGEASASRRQAVLPFLTNRSSGRAVTFNHARTHHKA